MTPVWQPQPPSDETVEDLPLNEWVGQALGSASMCWENPAGAGVFDSSRCGEIYEALMAHLNEAIDAVIAGTRSEASDVQE